jgi:hypothetical protein
LAISTYTDVVIPALRSLVGLYREQLGKGLHRSRPTGSDEERLKAEVQELEQLLRQLVEIEPNSEND